MGDKNVDTGNSIREQRMKNYELRNRNLKENVDRGKLRLKKLR